MSSAEVIYIELFISCIIWVTFPIQGSSILTCLLHICKLHYSTELE